MKKIFHLINDLYLFIILFIIMETTAALTTNTFKLSGNLKPLDKDIA